MKVIHLFNLQNTEREVHCPNGGFISNRFLLEKDGMGFTLTKTIIPKGDWQFWHYKNHLEACYCVSGYGLLKSFNDPNCEYKITPDTVYVLDKHDAHFFKAESTVVLICVFNPPLVGNEVHQRDGSYRGFK